MTSSRSEGCTSGSFVRTTPRCRPVVASPARLSAVRPPPATSSTGAPWTWTSRTRTVSSPGTTRRFAPRASAPPRSVPVTTVPRPLIRNARSTARRTGRADSATQPRIGQHPVAECHERRHATPRSPRRWSPTRPRSALRRAPWMRAVRQRPRTPRRPLCGHEIGLGDGHQRVPDVQRVEQVEVLMGLGAEAVIGGHDEQGRIDLAGTHEHVADEPVVAGDVDEVQLGAIGQREVRVPDVDRHPAAALLRKAVGVDAGERAEERRLAVVDMAGRADDHGHGSRARPSAAAIAPGSRDSGSSSTVRRSRMTRPSSTRASTHGEPRRSAATTRSGERTASATPQDGSVSPGSDPPPMVERTSTAAGAPRAGEGRDERFGSLAERVRAAWRSSARPEWRSRPGPPDRARASRRRRPASPCPVASPAPAGPCASSQRGPRDRRPTRPAGRRPACRR